MVRELRTAAAAGLLGLMVMAWSPGAAAQARCPLSYGGADSAKPNRLYIYFPTAADSAFPATSSLTGNLAAFNIADLTSYTGTADDLRNRIRDVVVDDYCEMNVQIISTTTNPDTLTPAPARRNAIGVSTADAGGLYGQVQTVDIGDATAVDYGRVAAGSYVSQHAGTGGVLAGANGTLERWANAIGGTVAHEAGHNFGLQHSDDTASRTGEDAVANHIMPAGANVPGANRVAKRHFSDITFGILASNVGLSVQTVHNWDFVNPNNVNAAQLRIEVLSTAASLVLAWSYDGDQSPWRSPTVTKLTDTLTFKGTIYNRYNVTWSTANPAWTQAAGVAPPGAKIHVGATFTDVDFSATDPVIVRDVVLLDAAGSALTLHPRLFGYDSATFDTADASMNLNMFNADAARPLEVRDIVVRQLPRIASLFSMLQGVGPFAWDGVPILPWRTTTCPGGQLVDTLVCPIAKLNQVRNVFFNRQDEGGPEDRAGGLHDSAGPFDGNDFAPGISVDLFPATSVYVTAKVVDPNAVFWNPSLGRFVQGPLETGVFYQFTGRHPDLNKNGKDDFVEIASGTAPDGNGNGIPDEADCDPRITAPPATTISSCTGPNIGQPIAHGVCSSTLTITNDAPARFSVGDTIVTWKVVDAEGRSATATQVVTATLADDASCCPAGYKVIRGTSGNNNLKGTEGKDCILGLGGNDVISASIGDDLISGGSGDDTLSGGDGNDRIFGGNGKDTITGGTGHDVLLGDADRDTISGGSGDDRIDGGNGDDALLAGDDGHDIINGGSGKDLCKGGNGEDTISGGDHDDVIAGGTGHDTLLGDAGNDKINAEDGNDLIRGGIGDDTMTGDNGHDVMFGEAGNDKIVGGFGSDFVDGGDGTDACTDLAPLNACEIRCANESSSFCSAGS
jgi:Ca2+-binding RTX toxin-like protein